MKRLLLSLIALVLSAGAASTQVANNGPTVTPLGYCQLTLTVAVALSTCPGGIPAGATMAYLVAEVAPARYRDDGVAPTAAIGVPINFGGLGVMYSGTLSKMQVIAGSTGTILDVAFYR